MLGFGVRTVGLEPTCPERASVLETAVSAIPPRPHQAGSIQMLPVAVYGKLRGGPRIVYSVSTPTWSQSLMAEPQVAELIFLTAIYQTSGPA